METFPYVHRLRTTQVGPGTQLVHPHISGRKGPKERFTQTYRRNPMTYRGVEYAQPKMVEAKFDGDSTLTYRGVAYQKPSNQLERIRRMKTREARYRGAQMIMAMA